MRISFLLMALMVSGGALANEPEGFRWECKPTGKNTMQCAIQNTSSRPGEMCTQVVAVCKYGQHVASICSGQMQPGAVTQKVIPAFEPKIRLLESCAGIEYRDTAVTRN